MSLYLSHPVFLIFEPKYCEVLSIYWLHVFTKQSKIHETNPTWNLDMQRQTYVQVQHFSFCVILPKIYKLSIDWGEDITTLSEVIE